VFGIRLDRFDDQVKLIGAVDFSRDAINVVVCDRLGFSEVVQPIDPASGMVLHDEDNTGAVFRPGEQEEIIGAEIEHEMEGQGGRASLPPMVSAVEGLARRTPP